MSGAYPVVGHGHGGAKPPIGAYWDGKYRPVCMPPRDWEQWEMTNKPANNIGGSLMQATDMSIVFASDGSSSFTIDYFGPKTFYTGHKYLKITPSIITGGFSYIGIAANSLGYSGAWNDSIEWESGAWSKDYMLFEYDFYRCHPTMLCIGGVNPPAKPIFRLAFSWAD